MQWAFNDENNIIQSFTISSRPQVRVPVGSCNITWKFDNDLIDSAPRFFEECSPKSPGIFGTLPSTKFRIQPFH